MSLVRVVDARDQAYANGRDATTGSIGILAGPASVLRAVQPAYCPTIARAKAG